MYSMLQDYTISTNLRYAGHHLIVSGLPGNPAKHRELSDTPIRLGGIMGAALLCALLTDTEEGEQRDIHITTDADRVAWIERYENEVRRDDWGLLSSEIRLLSEDYIELATSEVTLTDICPQIRLLDLAIQLIDTYMHNLVIDQFGAHIWEGLPWFSPFAEWLLAASRVETRRQRFLHTDWTDAALVTALAEMPDKPEAPTLIFEGEAADDIMRRYFDWAWQTYQAELRQMPGVKPKAAKYRNYMVDQETDWQYLNDDIQDFTPAQHRMWNEWFYNWQTFITRQLKPEKPVQFWVEGVSIERQDQLTDFLRLQEREPRPYVCLTAAVYALRQLGYIRRNCSVTDIARWLSNYLQNDYTEKNALYQFRRAWKEHGRYTPYVLDMLDLLKEHGVTKFAPAPAQPARN